MAIDTVGIEIFGVYSRGVPNEERIILRTSAPVSLFMFALILGRKALSNSVVPIADQFLWLGMTDIAVPSWIFIYTGIGTPTISQETHTKDPIHTLYWNRRKVLLSDPEVVPALIRLDWLEIGSKGETPVQNLSSNNNQTDLDKIVQRLLADQGYGSSP